MAYTVSTEEAEFTNDDFEDEDYERKEDKVGIVYRIGIDIWQLDL